MWKRHVILLGASMLATACSDAPTLELPDREVCLERADGTPYCIGMYEASRRDASEASAGDDVDSPPQSVEGRRPWVDVTWEGARAACVAAGKRLCERDEWIDACDGVPGEGGATYGYEGQLDPEACRTADGGAGATGSLATCRSATGTFDQSGNVWEWTGNTIQTAAARGGSFRSSNTHRCTSGDGIAIFDPRATSLELGFRCCR